MMATKPLPSPSPLPPADCVDQAHLKHALLSFAGRIKGVSDPKVQNALAQLRRDLKRAKIDIDN